MTDKDNKKISTIEELAMAMHRRFFGIEKTLAAVHNDLKTEVTQIHSDLIQHDKRADEMMQAIKELQDYGELARKVDRIREYLHREHNAQV